MKKSKSGLGKLGKLEDDIRRIEHNSYKRALADFNRNTQRMESELASALSRADKSERLLRRVSGMLRLVMTVAPTSDDMTL